MNESDPSFQERFLRRLERAYSEIRDSGSTIQELRGDATGGRSWSSLIVVLPRDWRNTRATIAMPTTTPRAIMMPSDALLLIGTSDTRGPVLQAPLTKFEL
jgi:hypothetical protein